MSHASVSFRERVLVVDDHEISRRYTAAALSQNGCSVKQAQGLGEALEIILAWYPATVFVDWNLADGTGGDVLRLARQHRPRGLPEPYFVLLTGHRFDSLPQDMAACRFDRILTKPCSAANLALQVRALGENVRETSSCEQAEIRRMFLAELESSIPELDRQIGGRHLGLAADITHRLIASSALCRETELETTLRSLHSAIRLEPEPGNVAASWCRFRQAAGDCLAGVSITG